MNIKFIIVFFLFVTSYFQAAYQDNQFMHESNCLSIQKEQEQKRAEAEFLNKHSEWLKDVTRRVYEQKNVVVKKVSSNEPFDIISKQKPR